MNNKCNLKNPQFPCALNVNENVEAIQFSLCKFWVHIECNYLNFIDYKYFQSADDLWFCATVCSTIFPFASLNNNCFLSAISCDRFIKNNEEKVETNDTSLLLHPSTNLALGLK